MTEKNILHYETVQAAFAAAHLQLHASEIHGALTGMICGGFRFESNDYLTVINDMFNNGEGLPAEVKRIVKQVYGEVWQAVLEDSYSFQPLLPDDDESLAERTNAMTVWVQGFNLGFAMQKQQIASLTTDVQEVITDFSEIANLSTEVEEDEENEQAYYEVVEYVRISAMLVFAELGLLPDDKPTNETLH